MSSSDKVYRKNIFFKKFIFFIFMQLFMGRFACNY
ncbi:hypothetical protein E2C01_062057 [Portunus trituberculatus]|uniref:Uncharacterized protein n=1 Tax=Portunus trituberculatus TaxID=210409 RepID=A0A5B7H5G9_PORTR|nr:hypothetical protein [Portunus trituberculatus]